MLLKDMPELTPADIERFWSRVDDSGGPGACWPWVGKRSSAGYGSFSIVRDGWTKAFIASRVAWVIAHGTAIPAGGIVRHTCDNPSCCNPAHLLTGTMADNIHDCIERGRYRGAGQPGTRHSKAKFTEDDVRAVRALAASGTTSTAELARRYGVSSQAIRNLVDRKTWRHVE